MCERYTYIPTASEVKAYQDANLGDLSPNYNVAPMQKMPVITSDGLEVMKWGLVPSTSKEFKSSFTSINARGETLADKPIYRTPFKKYRCLVPASGFYGWQQRPTFKQSYYFSLKEQKNFHFAGLFDVWYDAQSVAHKSFTIITTSANKTIEDVQDRMPVILHPADEALWLDYAAEPEALQLLLRPYEDDDMVRYEVDRSVGNIKNNHKDLLLPLNSK